MGETVTGLSFAKGHGTGNDFIVLPDPDGDLVLTAGRVAALCDRRRGLGADGVLRVVRTAAEPDVAVEAGAAEWFMDHRNADGSLAEMCGNGARVFARFLVEEGYAAGPSVAIWTRSGLVRAEVEAESVAVDLPMPVVCGRSTAKLPDRDVAGTVVVCGNPNLVCWVDNLDVLDLTGAPQLDPLTFPAGGNVEFVAPGGPGQVRVRVVERGVGETLSCGSGACAVAAVVLGAPDSDRAKGPDRAADPVHASRPAPGTIVAGHVAVDVPGGRLRVSIDNERCVLSGPAVIVATGTVVGWPW